MNRFYPFWSLSVLLGPPRLVVAQSTIAPFGVPVDVLTLSQGRYREVFAHDSLRRLGSVLYDTRQHRIAYLLPAGSLTGQPEAAISSRWLSVDPLAAKFAYISPYSFSFNNPIAYNDPDGRKPRVTIVKDAEGNTAITVTSTIFIIAKTKEEETSVMATFSKTHEFLPTHSWTDETGKKTTLTFVQNVVTAKDEDGINALEAEAAKTGGAFVEVQQAGHGDRADYTYGGPGAKDIDILSLEDNASAASIAHELGHDYGFADKYLEMVPSGRAAVLKGFLNTLMGQEKPLSLSEAQSLARAIMSKAQPNGVYTPISMKDDFPVKAGGSAEVYLPAPGSGGGVDESSTSNVKVIGGNKAGSKTLQGKQGK